MLQSAQDGKRFTELDSLRGLAAMAVVLGHFAGGLSAAPPAGFLLIAHLFGSGHAAVVLFFLLSGFVLTVPYTAPNRPSYPAFLIKRICRIYVPYVVAILVAAAFASKLYATAVTGNAWIDQTWNRPFSTRLLVQHLGMIGHYDDVQWNTAIWSLVIEMRISIVFPVIAWCTARLHPLLLLALCVPATPALAWVARRSGHGMLCDTLFLGMIFLVGSVLLRRLDRVRGLLARCTQAQSFAVLVVGLACYEWGDCLPLPHTGIAAYASDWLLALGGALLLLLSLSWEPLRRLLRGRVLLWLGTRSYSIYLLHGTVLFTLIRTHRMQQLHTATLVAYLSIVLTASELFHRMIELPALRMGRRLGTKTVPNHMLPGPAASLVAAWK